MCAVNGMYLEGLIGVPVVYLEAFDGHRRSLVFSLTHFCNHPIVADYLNLYVFILNDT